MQRRQLENWWGTRLAGLLFAFGIAGCSASGDGLVSEPCRRGSLCVAPYDAGGDADAGVHPGSDSSLGDAAASRSGFCGIVGCFPGNPSACGATPEGDSSTWSFAAEPDAAEDAAQDDALPEREPAAPDASEDAARVDASFDSGGPVDASVGPRDAPSAPGDVGVTDEPKVQRSCYVRPSDAIPGSRVVTECAPVGQGAAGSDCQDSSECGALLACVDIQGKPTCRRFSCALPTSCPSGSYYQLEPLRVSGATLADVKVPVCLPTDGCDLMASPSSCPRGQVCAVVGSEGDTTCIVPGTAKLGDPCDDLNLCAEGLVCSKLKNQCLKICRVAAGMTECPGGTCQGGNRSLPDGFGICVGTHPDGG